MARYYSYGRRRYGRRYSRRGYRRYGGTSIRRYRSIQMNDDETKVMTFSNVRDLSSVLIAGVATSTQLPLSLLGTDAVVVPASGRLFFAGMMFDRLRFRSFSITIRPKVMPSSSATNYVVYAAWDRYGAISDGAAENSYSIRTDPSAKQVVWTPGGSGAPLRTWIYSTRRDRYQYLPISHTNDLTSWTVPYNSTNPQFFPTLLLAVEAVTTESTVVQYTVHSRVTIEFQGGYSNTTLNYTPSSAAAAQASASPLEQRIAALESKYNSNPADNNDDFVSVLNELSLLGITQFVENGHEVIIIVGRVGVIPTFEESDPLFEGSRSVAGHVKSRGTETSLELNDKPRCHIESDSSSIVSSRRNVQGENQNREERLRGRLGRRRRRRRRESPSGLIVSNCVGGVMDDADVLETVTVGRIDPSTKRRTRTSGSPHDLLGTGISKDVIWST